MNWIDALLVAIILLAVWAGWQRGFLAGSLSLFSWIASACFGFIFYPFLAKAIEKYLPSLGVWSAPLSLIIAITAIRILLSLMVDAVLQAVSKGAHRSPLNHAAGMLPGFVNGLILASLFAALLFSLSISKDVTDTARNSVVADNFVLPAEWLNEKLSPVFDKAVNKSMNKLTVEPESNKIVKLPFKTPDFVERPDLEMRMLKMVNQERLAAKLPLLTADSALKKVALAHSADMFKRGYFAHLTPEGSNPFDRMREAHIRFTLAGENLALAQTLSLAHEGLMNSKGHRENILRPGFGRIGIGILDGGRYGIMVSQEFRN